jgi:hypothetical protein
MGSRFRGNDGYMHVGMKGSTAYMHIYKPARVRPRFLQFMVRISPLVAFR